MTLFRKLFAPFVRSAPTPRPVRLGLELLEGRLVPSTTSIASPTTPSVAPVTAVSVVPLSQGIDGATTFHRLQDAVNAVGSGSVITVEPGATADLGPITVNTSGLTITGDPNVPGSILPSYDIVVDAPNVTLTRLNLGSVTIDADATGDAVTRSTVNTITITGDSGGAGNVLIDQDAITGSVSATGLVASPLLNVSVTNNTFNTMTPASTSPIINLEDVTNAIVQNNNITGGGPAPQIGIQVTRGLNNLIANNTIQLSGSDLNTDAIVLENPGTNALTTVTVRNNTLATGQGSGLYINAFSDVNMQASVQGNDFHNNAIGVEYLGSDLGPVSSDLGGGLNDVGSSLGGNDFRGYPQQGTATNAAIVLRNVATGGVLSAHLNIFDNPTAASSAVVTATGSGTIDVGQALDTNRAFVQTLYNDMLGRTGTIAELNTWVATLTAGGANGEADVLNGILRSTEALDRVIDQYYLEYLGRTADAAGQAYWVDQIQGGMTLAQVQAGFLSSPEFLSDNNSDYVQGLYRTFFDRTGSSTELAYWYTQLPTLGLTGVALAFSQSPENRTVEVTALFNEFLHRAPTASELAKWTAATGDFLTVEVNLLSSGGFYTNG